MDKLSIHLSALILVFIFSSSIVFAQGTNMEYTKIQVGDATSLQDANDPFIGIDKTPGSSNMVALSSVKRGPLFIFNYETQEVVKDRRQK